MLPEVVTVKIVLNLIPIHEHVECTSILHLRSVPFDLNMSLSIHGYSTLLGHNLQTFSPKYPVQGFGDDGGSQTFKA